MASKLRSSEILRKAIHTIQSFILLQMTITAQSLLVYHTYSSLPA